jgi:hypothetical protein
MARRLTTAKSTRPAEATKRGRGRPRETEPQGDGAGGAARRSNVPESVFLEHFRSFDRLTRQKDEAVATLRAHRKLMKEQGVDLRAFDRAYKAKTLDDDTRAAAYRNEDIYLKYLRVPTGTQFGFFQEEIPIDDGKAEDDGYFAGKEGKSSIENPHLMNSIPGQAWQREWLRAQTEIAQSLKQDEAPAATQ